MIGIALWLFIMSVVGYLGFKWCMSVTKHSPDRYKNQVIFFLSIIASILIVKVTQGLL
jgi:nicotinamide riboside transporter PnuC